jgi:hypothetical protein
MVWGRTRDASRDPPATCCKIAALSVHEQGVTQIGTIIVNDGVKVQLAQGGSKIGSAFSL